MTFKKRIKIVIAVLFALSAILLYNSAYIVTEKDQVVVFQFGNPVKESRDPGLYFKAPFIQDIKRFEKRILEWDGDPTVIPMSGDMFISVDTFARWTIINAEDFYKSVINESGAQSRLDDIINGVVKDRVSLAGLEEIVSYTELPEKSQGRLEIVQSILDRVQATLSENSLGIRVEDVQIKRIDYSETVQKNVFKQIESNQKVKAEKLRSEGQRKAREIEGKIEFEKKKILSDAYAKSEKIKGQGDAQAAEIYAKSYNQDRKFYNFIKTLETYKDVIDENSKVILTDDSDFFKFLKSK
ncbi:MAG: HflC protein [Candidatus Marinimicrobia bacterium]|nr:HflC protein [Candidatus Neomarinimicrobiota bacterium]